MAGGLTLGFDLGGTQVRAALVQDGKILKRAALRTDVAGGPESVMQQFRALAVGVAAPDELAQVCAVGVASPGPIDTIAGKIEHIPTLPGWDDFPLRDRISALFTLPCVVENDGISAAYGEWQHGAGKGFANIVYATVSTGIGGGVVVDGRLLHGRKGMAGHIGHFQMDPLGPVCNCGAAGCFEAFAAGPALAKRARVSAKANPHGYLGSIATNGQIDSHHVVEGARDGDNECLSLLRQEARFLGTGFTGLAHLFSPDRIIMGGGVSQAFDLLSDEIHATIRNLAMPPFKTIQVVPAALGDNAGLLGVASLALGGTSN
jgi:glucokinase